MAPTCWYPPPINDTGVPDVTSRVTPGLPGQAESQTTESGSSFWPVGPIWMSVFISGHTPQS